MVWKKFRVKILNIWGMGNSVYWLKWINASNGQFLETYLISFSVQIQHFEIIPKLS